MHSRQDATAVPLPQRPASNDRATTLDAALAQGRRAVFHRREYVRAGAGGVAATLGHRDARSPRCSSTGALSSGCSIAAVTLRRGSVVGMPDHRDACSPKHSTAEAPPPEYPIIGMLDRRGAPCPEYSVVE
ncbi:hypothetical protein Y023_2746 [Burkholderia pseudomallei A79D]|nr:hypothetical protein Y023_2746 [Burkholderia pseudomallei A79D]KGY03338.1 hypothetical protein X997_2544 [Burkholderia pseudomallei A79C]